MEHGPTDDINSLSDYKAIYNLLKTTLEPSAVPNGGGVRVPWVKSDNLLYKIGFALQMSDDEISKFGAIKHIIIINNMINFILQPLFVIGFNCHKQGYEIQFDFENNLPCSWVMRSNSTSKIICHVAGFQCVKMNLLTKCPSIFILLEMAVRFWVLCSNNFLFVSDFKYIVFFK
jgi:hypothetical protein